jgi:hypothetical protein
VLHLPSLFTLTTLADEALLAPERREQKGFRRQANPFELVSARHGGI